ncbi:hypothetical protein MRX96_027498 [Rhipicephalus microplus]
MTLSTRRCQNCVTVTYFLRRTWLPLSVPDGDVLRRTQRLSRRALSLAAKRWDCDNDEITANFNECTDRTSKGTHLLITFDQEPGKQSRLAGAVVQGKSLTSSVFAGFPVEVLQSGKVVRLPSSEDVRDGLGYFVTI